MLAKIKTFFEKNLSVQPTAPAVDQVYLAAAALLIELSYADHQLTQIETDKMLAILHNRFAIPRDQLEDLIALAEEEAKNATSLYQFTRLINDNYSEEDKFQLIRSMWDIAYADGDIDKYEEALIRKVADLIHLSHSFFIRAKHLARDSDPINRAIK